MMAKLTQIVICGLAIALFVSCKSKPQSPDIQAPEGTALNSEIKSTPMKFSPEGSDSNEIKGLTTIHFDYDQSTLTSVARKELAENADWIKSHTDVTIQIEGHCDKRGSTEYNLALGERRAKAVKNYLSSLGIDSKRMTVISYGEEKPIDPADTEAAYAKNRRANFVPISR